MLYDTPQTNTAAINTNVVINIPAATAPTRKVVSHISFSHDRTPAAKSTMTVESPSGTILGRWHITAGGPGFIPLPRDGIRGAEGQAILVRLALDAASNTIATLNVQEGTG